MLANKLMSALSGAEEKLYVDDVFSTYLYTGNSSAQTINNGIDLAGKGGLVWIKSRSNAYSNLLYDTNRGALNALFSETTDSAFTQTGSLTSFNSSGFNLGSNVGVNQANATYTSWNFRRAAKFFDVVTYTGNGAVGGNNSQVINHSLGVTPGMIVVKASSAAGTNWVVWHKNLTNTYYILRLNTTDAQANYPCIDTVGASSFTVYNQTTNPAAEALNDTGVSYVAYLFAHDPSADGIIQCGSFTGSATVNLGWEPQYILFKRTDGPQDWFAMDTMRGIGASGSYFPLNPNLSAAEGSFTNGPTINATGFIWIPGATASYIYLAIRRPNKPPTTGTQVYNAIARTGTGAVATVTGVGFAPDLVISQERVYATVQNSIFDRLRGAGGLISPSNTNAEVGYADTVREFGVDGVSYGADQTLASINFTYGYINHFFRRAPGILSQICYSGTGSNKAEAHDLGVAPELWLVKGRSGATQWVWGSSLLAATEKIVMPTPAGKVTDATAWNSTYPTASVLSLGTAAAVNSSAATYTAYLWTTKAGVSKVFGYVGNGSSQNIDCGFTTGARFILIVRTNAAGSVYIWDTVRGVVAGNDPHLALDTTAAEVTTDDSVDPLASGFSVNQLAATNINVNGSTYIGLAYA